MTLLSIWKRYTNLCDRASATGVPMAIALAGLLAAVARGEHAFAVFAAGPVALFSLFTMHVARAKIKGRPR